MQIKDEIGEVLHKMQVKLYPNYLQNVEGNYIARTESEATLGIRQVCGTAITLGGVDDISQDRYADYVNRFFSEMAYQLCDGYSVSLDYFSVHPVIGDPFDTPNEPHDHAKHPVNFKFRVLGKMRRLAHFIDVEVTGVSDGNAFIDEFVDYEADSVNAVLRPGDQFAVHGHKIKLAGDDPGVGLFLVPVDNPAGAVQVTRMAENSPSRLTGTLPSTLTGHVRNRLEIRTRFSGAADKPLKEIRVISSPFTLEEC
jgi:hypothetical protein